LFWDAHVEATNMAPNGWKMCPSEPFKPRKSFDYNFKWQVVNFYFDNNKNMKETVAFFFPQVTEPYQKSVKARQLYAWIQKKDRIKGKHSIQYIE
jgi:hypothetical protein